MPTLTRRALAAGTALLLMSGAALAQAPIVIKFSHVVAPDTPKGRGAGGGSVIRVGEGRGEQKG